MQRDLPSIDFKTQAEVRLQAESRRTEEVAGLLRDLFSGWRARIRQFERPIFHAVPPSRQSVTGGNQLAHFDRA
jgi:hypothetical protein